MRRRDQQTPPLRVRASHETTRYSSRWLAEAFERLLPQVERRVSTPGRCLAAAAAVPLRQFSPFWSATGWAACYSRSAVGCIALALIVAPVL